MDWLDRVGLPYHSPHKFRHGHAVYALKNAKDVPALKAVSQNLMHSNLSITDVVYGVLSENDVRGEITKIYKSLDQYYENGQGTNELISQIEKLLDKFKNGNTNSS